jgi:hypothetical protein
MPREFLSRFSDNVKSKLLPQRGLKASLRREVANCFEYFDKIDGGPISSLHANGLTLTKLDRGKGYAVEIEEYRAPEEIDNIKFTYKDRITIRGRKILMQQINPVETLARQSISREKVETVIYMIQHVTVPYQQNIEGKRKRRARAEDLVARATGRLPARGGGAK